MTSTKILRSLLITTLLGCGSAYAAGDTYQGTEDAKPIKQFKTGNSRCELVNGQLRCAVGK